MQRRILILIGILLIALLPASALADSHGRGDRDDDFLLRFNGPINLAHDETAGTVVSISDDVNIAGRVTEALFVIDGDARISGTVYGDVVAFGGSVELLPGARVTGDLTLFDSHLLRDRDTTVEGTIRERGPISWSGWDTFMLSAFIWVGLTLLTLAIALLFAAAGGRQLVSSARLITERPGPTLLAALLGGILIPMLALIAFLSFFGIPIGVTLLAVLMPVMLVLGYVVAGTRVGLAFAGRGQALDQIDHPYLAALGGVMLLNVIGIMPFIGGLVQFLAAVIGAGALTLLAFEAWRGGREPAPALPAQNQPLPTS